MLVITCNNVNTPNSAFAVLGTLSNVDVASLEVVEADVMVLVENDLQTHFCKLYVRSTGENTTLAYISAETFASTFMLNSNLRLCSICGAVYNSYTTCCAETNNL